MMLRLSPLLLALTGATVLSLSSPALAQDDPRKAQAELLFQEGLKLHDKDREAEALEKFQKSHAIYPSPSTLVSIGREEQLLGRPLDALRHYRLALKQPLLNPKYAQLAKQYIAELEIRFGKVTVTGPSGTKLSLYGETLRLPLEEPLDVEPGTLLLRGDHDGKLFEGSVLAVAGETVSLDLKSAAVASTAPPPGGAAVVTPPPEEPAPSWWTTEKTAGVVLGALSLASFGGFVGFRVAAGSKGDDVDAAAKDPSAANGCKGVSSPACDRVNDGAASERDLTNVSTGMLIGGLALGAAATFFLWPRAKSNAASVTVTPQINATASTLVVGGSF
jgi:hypothetical protein